MRNDLTNSNWIDEFMNPSTQHSVEDRWSSLQEKIVDLRNRFVPKCAPTNSQSWRSKGNYPINKDAQQALKKKNRAYRAWMSTSDHREREACRGQYTEARNKAKTLLRKAKRTFEKNIAEQAKSNPKAFWSHTRSKLKTKSGVAPLLENPKDPKSLKFNDVDKANILQRQFSSHVNQMELCQSSKTELVLLYQTW